MIIGSLTAFVFTNGSLAVDPPALLDISANKIASTRNSMPDIMEGTGPLMGFISSVTAAPSRACCQNGVTNAPPPIISAVTDSFEYILCDLFNLLITTSKINPRTYLAAAGLFILTPQIPWLVISRRHNLAIIYVPHDSVLVNGQLLKERKRRSGDCEMKPKRKSYITRTEITKSAAACPRPDSSRLLLPVMRQELLARRGSFWPKAVIAN